jgi:hypothetical protein
MSQLIINNYVSLMYKLKKLEGYLRVNSLGSGPRLIKKNLPGRGLTNVEKHCSKSSFLPAVITRTLKQ